MPKQKDPSKRPCDFCRLKKKKCDGMTPCSSCTKSRRGPLTCTYTSRLEATLKQDAITDILRQLEYYKDIVRAIAPEKILPVDFDSSSKSEKSSLVAPTEMHSHYPESNLHHIPQVPVLDLEMFLLPTDSAVNQPPNQNDYNHLSMLTLNSSLMLQHAEIEDHLLDLGFLTPMGFSCRNDLSTVFPLDRTNGISDNLKRAVCYDTVFYSTHPRLFRNNTPSMQERIERSKSYEPNMLSLLTVTDDPFRLCDDIRALLVYTQTMMKLGNLKVAKHLLHHAGEFCRNHFRNDRNLNLRQQLRLQRPDSCDNNGEYLSNLQIQLAAEQNAVIYFLFATDLFMSLLTGDRYIIDQAELPPAPMRGPVNIGYPKRIKWERKYIPDFGKYTVFEGRRNGFYYGEMKEFQNILKSLVPDAPTIIRHQSGRMIFVRDLFVFEKSGRESIKSRLVAHMNILGYFGKIPRPFQGFDDLEPFVALGGENLPNILHLAPGPILETLSLFMATLSKVHENSALAEDMTLYPLSHTGQPKFSSQDVVFATFGAICHGIQEFKKLGPEHSFSIAHQYDHQSFENVVENPANICPLFISFSFILKTVLVSKIAINVFSHCISSSTAGSLNNKRAKFVMRMVEIEIIPCVQNFARVWPHGYQFVNELYTLLMQFPAAREF